MFGSFQMALAPGPIAALAYRRLMTDPQLRSFPWGLTRIWLLADTAPRGGPDAAADVHEWFGDLAGIPSDQMHAPPRDHDDPAGAYEAMLQENLGWREKGHDRLDFVLLAPPIDEMPSTPLPGADLDAPLVTEADGVIGMTLRCVNGARLIAALAPGEESRACVRRIARNQPEHREVTLASVNPVGGSLRWYVGGEACEKDGPA